MPDFSRHVLFCVLLFGIVLISLATPPASHAQPAADRNDVIAQDLYDFAVASYKQQDWETATAEFKKFLKNHSSHVKVPLARLYLGLSLVNQRDHKQAREILRAYAKDYPQSKYLADTQYRIAESSYLMGDLGAAEKEFKAFLAANPRHAFAEWAWPYLGDTQLRLNRNADAEASFQTAVKNYPNGRMLEDSKFGLARALERNRKFDPAEKLYRELAANTSSSRAPQAQFDVATLMFEQKKYAESAREYQKLVSAFPQGPLVGLSQFNTGNAYHELKDYANAIKHYEFAAHDPKQAVSAMYWKGICQKQLKQFDEAATTFEAAFKRGSQSPDGENILFRWAETEQSRNKLSSASELFLDVVKRWPKGLLADDALQRAAQIAFEQKQYDKTIELASRLSRDFKESLLKSQSELLTGLAYDAQGGKPNQEKAIAHLAQALKDARQTRDAQLANFHSARVHQALGQHAQAVTYAEPVVKEVEQQGDKSRFVDVCIISGISQLELKKYSEAAETSALYLRLKPTGSHADQALSTKALAEAYANNKPGTVASLDKLARDFPQSPLLPQTTQRLAEFAFSKQDFKWSGDLFEKLAKSGNDKKYRTAALSGQGWARFSDRKFPEAAMAFQTILKDHPDDPVYGPEAGYMYGYALQQSGKLAEAATGYSEAFNKYAPEKPAAPGAEAGVPLKYAYLSGLQAARLWKSVKKIEASDKAYEQLLLKFPHPKSLDMLLDEWALLNYNARNFKRADQIFARLINETPESDLADNAQLSIAESLFIEGKSDEARTIFRELADGKKSDAEVREFARINLIKIGVRKEDWEDVDKVTEELITRFPKSEHFWFAHLRRGEALLSLGKLEDSGVLLEMVKSQKANPKVNTENWFPRVWVLLAEVELRKKNYAGVATVVGEFQKHDSDSPFLYQANEILGRSYKNQARFDEARNVFLRVVADPHGRRTETAAKSQFMIAETHLIQKDYTAARTEYMKVYRLYAFPEWQAPALYQAALCDESRNNWDAAVRSYNDLIKDFPRTDFAKKAEDRLPEAQKRAGA